MRAISPFWTLVRSGQSAEVGHAVCGRAGQAIIFLLIRVTPHVRLYVVNMFRMRGSRLWGSRLHRACVV